MSLSGMSLTQRRMLRALVFACVVLLTLSAVGYMAETAPGKQTWQPFPVAAVMFTLLGALVVPRQPRNPVGWLFLAIGVVSAVVVASASFADFLPLQWLNAWSPFVAYGLLPLPVLLFPDGRLPSRRWRPVVWAAVGSLSVTVSAVAVAAFDVPTVLSEIDTPLTRRAQLAIQIGWVGALGIIASTVAAVMSLLVRWKKADGDTRQQLKWLTAGMAFVPISIALDMENVPWAWTLAGVAVPGAAGIAILKHRLYDIDLFLNRSLVYGVLTLLVVGGYAAIVTAVEDLIAARREGPSVVAAGLVAMAFYLREWVQRGANRLLYGDRDEPYAVLSRLGRQLEQAADPADVLPRVCESVCKALQVPYAAVELHAQGLPGPVVSEPGGFHEPEVVASHGRQVHEPEVFDMIYQGQLVGRLLISPRGPSQRFSRVERELIEDIARHAGVAAHAVRLSAALQKPDA